MSSNQSGVTLTEMLVTTALLASLAATTVTLSTPWLAREGARSAMHDLRAAIQLNRMEAINRNHPCRFTLDVFNRTLRVWDGMGTAGRDDDTLLHTSTIPAAASFARPDEGGVVTLDELDDHTYELVFEADGSVDGGQGEIGLYGGGRYYRLTMFIAGGTRVDEWNGEGWVSR